MLLEKVSDPAECSMLKVGASGVSQEKYRTVTSYAPLRRVCPFVAKVTAVGVAAAADSV